MFAATLKEGRVAVPILQIRRARRFPNLPRATWLAGGGAELWLQGCLAASLLREGCAVFPGDCVTGQSHMPGNSSLSP